MSENIVVVEIVNDEDDNHYGVGKIAEEQKDISSFIPDDVAEGHLPIECRKKIIPYRFYKDVYETMYNKFGYNDGKLSSALNVISLYLKGQKLLYLEAKAYCEHYLYRMMLPAIVISSTSSVISGIYSDNSTASKAVAGATALNTLILSLINYFKLDAKAEAHKMSAYSFEQLISECEFTSGKILLSNINENDRNKIIYGDFLKQNILKKYKTIIGNPPYVRTQKGNLYIDFIEKCYNLLEDNGELIFIIPSDFLKLTSASKILNKMIDIIIFRYCKNSLLEKKVLYNDELLYITNSNGLITFNKEDITKVPGGTNMFQDYFDIYVGLVSGKEDVYKNEELGNIEVLNKCNFYPCLNC